MKLKLAVVLSLPMLLGLSSCDKVSSLTSSGASCGDDTSIALINSLIEEKLQTEVKDVASYEDVRIDSAGLRASASQVKFVLDDIRTTKKDPNSTKEFCTATLITSLDADMIKRADFVREYYEQPNLNEGAFQQDIDMDGNTLTYNLEYAVQPTDDGKKTFGELQNGTDLLEFLATAVVYSMQKNDIQVQKAREQKAQTENAVAERKAADEAVAAAEQGIATAQREAASDMAAVSAEQAKAKATMDYKRNEFNKLWKTASAETRESLADVQKEWVEERDATCTDRAIYADAERQEIVRMECITELLGERYYQVKEYIDTYG